MSDTAILNAPSAIKHRNLLITGLIIAMLFGALDGTIVGTAMPRIVGELGGIGLMTWLTTAYMLTSTAVVPIAGKLADLLGRRVVYVSGLVIFMVGSALCGMAHHMTELIIYRGLQGIGGGIMMPMAMIIIGDLFTGKERAKWQGVFGGLYGLASILGPQVGGWIVDHMSWEWVFYINLPVGILATIFIAMGLNKHQATGPVKFDIAGMCTMIIGVVSLLLALTFGGDKYEWTSWQIIGLFAVAIVFLTAFVLVERKAEEPILPMHFFKNRTFTILNGLGFLMSVGMFGAIMFVPFFMQGVVGVSATQSGTIMTPMMITMIVGSIIGGRIVYKIGVKPQLIIGMLIMASGFGLLSTMDIGTTKWTATFYMIVLGLGVGLVMPLLTLALQETFPKSEIGVVTSSSQFFRSIGGTFGMTILGAIMNHRSSQILEERLMPTLTALPPQAKEMADKFSHMIHDNPQSLYSMLFSPEMLAGMPQQMKDAFIPILKHSLIESLHSVFLFGLVFIVCGAALTLALRKITLSDQRQKEKASA
ncbi:drug resistance MFS transporter, drug:H+ antiporter-2 family protein [Anoxybacillus sp. B7M1]|jgi:EmrB/QacA subfamily drug resistance transporter|uniref:MDR family MFS transporter n=1 Tax=Anoxybacteroides rupiense TaxID=311460 RepID=A0ABD5IXY5_9BACL|nr:MULTISPECIES: MDR family MFS transporter [Anoxybacillus]ANB59010.1 drug resistance MFS transporter, drug:H+ antiporter-2 family protein [Anoxybacillus sp. B2M1]ANB64194.1 drug resistance MFS transporter, drug:H+ antiporter-2 family protein [Anoxybacillus sp. B7M1]MBB3909087.1 EmrB/QacA subfamily drug resistance transporter [Anoxybacillus rupiensis]MBS2771285.1 MFS transporter [Anoxybacillus rupiensis]MDE8564782.1 MDR family MFS transporter [Anoxybacillus rupiensis]